MRDASARSAIEEENSEVIAVFGGTIIDGNGGTPINDGVVLIEGKRITAIGGRSIPIPAHANQIEATGKFVIPGLMAPHQYLVDGTWVPETIRYEGRYDEVAIEAAQLALKGGITTVFDAWGPRDPLMKARSAINDGRAVAARIFLSGNWIGIGGPFSPDMRQRFKEAVGDVFAARTNALWEVNVGAELTRMPMEKVREEVRKYVQSGIDYVNYPVNVHQTGVFQYITFSPRVQRMIVEEAHRAGLPVQAAFVTTEEGTHLALDSEADILALFAWGGKATSTETLALIAQRGIPTYFQAFPTDDLEWYRQRRKSMPEMLDLMESSEHDQRELIRNGALLIASTYSGVFSPDQQKGWSDSLPPGVHVPLGEGHVRGLEILQQKGMTPMDALMTATRNVARAFKIDKDLGTLAHGKFADLVILDGNPLENVQNYRNIQLVMKEGKVVDRDALPTQRLWTAQPKK